MIWLGIGAVLAFVYFIILVIAEKKYKPYTAPLKDKEHFFKVLYPVGFWTLEKIGYKYRTPFDKKRLKQCRVLYGEKYGEYYFRVNCAAKVSLMLFVLPFVFILFAVIKSPIVFLVGALCVFLAFYNYDMKITDITKVRDMEVARDFPDILSKLALLVNAGMIMTEAWSRVSKTGSSTIYQEMQKAVIDMQNGVSEVDAYLSFGNRCMNENVKKFASTLVQNVSKGNRELVAFLKAQNKYNWEEKKHTARRLGEVASGKLLIPIALMFIGILVMILIPIFTNMSFSL